MIRIKSTVKSDIEMEIFINNNNNNNNNRGKKKKLHAKMLKKSAKYQQPNRRHALNISDWYSVSSFKSATETTSMGHV